MALRIGLTGGIGAGKSTVAHIFKVLGIPVFDADTAAKTLMETNTSLRESLVKSFGEGCFTNGKLNKKFLADIVFKDPFQLALVNAMVHPYTIAAAEEWAKEQKSPYTVKEAALFFESGAAIGFDYMIGVMAPVHLCIKRAMQRDGLSHDEVKIRMHKQISPEIKMRLCDFVIINDEQQLLIPQVLQLHEKFMQATQKL